jgi:hypothetical protein
MNTHPVSLSAHERVMVCTRCHVPILVCGYVADLVPDTYVGVACGCRRELAQVAQAVPAVDLVGTIAKAQRAQKEAA